MCALIGAPQTKRGRRRRDQAARRPPSPAVVNPGSGDHYHDAGTTLLFHRGHVLVAARRVRPIAKRQQAPCDLPRERSRPATRAW